MTDHVTSVTVYDLASQAHVCYNVEQMKYVAQALRQTTLSVTTRKVSSSYRMDSIPLWSKRCSKCGEEKNLSQFYHKRIGKDGKQQYASWCKLCQFIYNRKKPTKSSKEIAADNLRTGTKTCANCNETLSLEKDFYRKTASRDDRDSWCKRCRSVHDRKMLEKRTAKPLPSLGSKKCSQCGEEKPYSAFSRQGNYYCSSCKACVKARRKELFTPHKAHGERLQHRYHMTEQEYNAMLEAQGGVCACCGNEETSFDRRTNAFRKLAVDHDHTTGEVRALLCAGCNTSLGALKEDPKRIQALLSYILKYKGGQL